MYTNLEEKIIIVSNYVESLTIFENLCRKKRYPFVRFDGTTKISTRQSIVDKFNEDNKSYKTRSFILLLSAKAGGCGLNLYGCNRMILLDPDWNPSNDQQVMGRIWRVGQLRRVYIYRMYASNSIEERILDIQRKKENLSDTIIDGKKATVHKKFSDEVISTLFDYRDNEDFGLKSMNEEMQNTIHEVLFKPDGPILDLIQFYDLKVTENESDSDDNEFDLAKKEEAIPDSDDDESEEEEATRNQSGLAGNKRPAPSKVGGIGSLNKKMKIK